MSLEATARLAGSLADRELAVDAELSREEMLWQLLDVLSTLPRAGVALAVVDEGAGRFRVLAKGTASAGCTTSLRQGPVQQQLVKALAARRPLHLALAGAAELGTGLPAALKWAWLLPLRLPGYFEGLIGAGGVESASSVEPDPSSRRGSPSTAGETEVAEMLVSLERDIHSFIRHAALREQAFAAGMAHESQFLGTELHDSVLQDLSFIRIQLGRLRMSIPPEDERSQAIIREVGSVISATSREMRQLCQSLTAANPGADPLDGMANVIEKFQARCATVVNFSMSGERRRIGSTVSNQLVRVLQEALNNTWKHAEATTVDICLGYQPDRLVLRVADDGVGFDVNKRESSPLGLRGMERRVKELHGQLRIESAVGAGTLVQAEVPA